MKIRVGFVSNSSSSSYLIYGVKLTKDQLLGYLGVDEDEVDWWDLEGLVNLDIFFRGYKDSIIYVGKSLTGVNYYKNIEKRVNMEVEEMFGADHECGFYDGAWFDG